MANIKGCLKAYGQAGILVLVGTGIVYAIVGSFMLDTLAGICVATLCNAAICGALSVLIGKDRYYFWLGFLAGEIGLVITLFMKILDRVQQKETAEKISPKVREKKTQDSQRQDRYSELERLGTLREKKILTEKEFQAEKKKILGGAN